MSGSGRGFFHTSKEPSELSDKYRQAERRAIDKGLEIEVSNIINNLLVSINDRDANSIQKHLNEIRKALVSDIEGVVTLRYGGSVAKHTYVDGLSDIDSLVLVNNSELSKLSPNEVKEYFSKRLQQRFPNTSIKVGALAVTLDFSDGTQIQLLPALKYSTGYKIATKSGQWSNIIKPEKFALSLRAANIKLQGKLLPTIKLAKSMISKLPDGKQISGYHTEALAIDAFSNYKGEIKVKNMLSHFFSRASELVQKPIVDRSNQSIHVDDYLEGTNSLKRKIASDSLHSISRKLRNADAIGDWRIWGELLN